MNVGKHCAALVAQVIFVNPTARLALFNQLLALPKSDTPWHIRATMLPFLQYELFKWPVVAFWTTLTVLRSGRLFLFNHRFILTENEISQVRELVISMLSDPRIEVALVTFPAHVPQSFTSPHQVRELASGSLSSLLHGEEETLVTVLSERFLEALGKPVTRRTASSGTASSLQCPLYIYDSHPHHAHASGWNHHSSCREDKTWCSTWFGRDRPQCGLHCSVLAPSTPG